MARLVIKSDGFRNQVIELRLGVNRFGRGKDNDFRIEHITISACHCELELSHDGVLLRDCNSTNGTFLDGEPVQEARVEAGQSVHLGEVELLVETTDAKVAIPKFDVPVQAPPVVLSDGSLVCPRHPQAQVTHRCTHCREVMCDQCVRRMRRRGGKTLKLCPLCSHHVELIGGEKKKKKTLMAILQKTMRLPFIHAGKSKD